MRLELKLPKAAFFVGIAIFSMIFGAGNLVFPVAIGNIVGGKYALAFLGILLSSIIIPLAGFVACLGYQGSYERFLSSWVGRIPAVFLTLCAMLLLGPLGCIPRCATLAHAALSWNLIPGISLFWFSILFFITVFVLSYKQDELITILGKFLGPINLVFMAVLVVKGILMGSGGLSSQMSGAEGFSIGFFESYKTFDLLAMIFYAGTIVVNVRHYLVREFGQTNERSVMSFCLAGGLIGAIIFALVYSGFCYMAASNAGLIPALEKEKLISAYSTAILGSRLGVLAGMIVFIACLNSACALSVVFSRYLKKMFSGLGVGYTSCLFMTTIFSVGLANLGFRGIDQAMSPVMKFIYPVLIVISIIGCLSVLLFRRGKLAAE